MYNRPKQPNPYFIFFLFLSPLFGRFHVWLTNQTKNSNGRNKPNLNSKYKKLNKTCLVTDVSGLGSTTTSGGHHRRPRSPPPSPTTSTKAVRSAIRDGASQPDRYQRNRQRWQHQPTEPEEPKKQYPHGKVRAREASRARNLRQGLSSPKHKIRRKRSHQSHRQGEDHEERFSRSHQTRDLHPPPRAPPLRGPPLRSHGHEDQDLLRDGVRSRRGAIQQGG